MRLPNGYGGITKLKGNRRRPYRVRVTTGFHFDKCKDRMVQDYAILGYAATRSEALRMLAEYNNSPFDLSTSDYTFAEVFRLWSEEKFLTIGESDSKSYMSLFRNCPELHKYKFRDLRLKDLQGFVDHCGKNYPTIARYKIMIKQMYDYAIRNEICTKNYGQYIDIIRHKDKNSNKQAKGRFTKDEISSIWVHSDNEDCQIVLILIYGGYRIGELLDLKREDVHLEERYVRITKSKTENGIRDIPIAEKVYDFYKSIYEKNEDSVYFLREHYTYKRYVPKHFDKALKLCGISHGQTPHWTRHTCTSMMADANINPTIQKKILGHTSAMSVTERVYTHMDRQVLIDAINKI